VTDLSSKQPQPQATDNGTGPAIYIDPPVCRKVSVTGTGGVAATVFVTVQRGQVWMSIQPPFTWEAIMEPGKVDELMRTLELAREDVKRMAMARGKSAVRGRQAVVREVTSGAVNPSR
jgi:hypothetical protein